MGEGFWKAPRGGVSRLLRFPIHKKAEAETAVCVFSLARLSPLKLSSWGRGCALEGAYDAGEEGGPSSRIMAHFLGRLQSFALGIPTPSLVVASNNLSLRSQILGYQKFEQDSVGKAYLSPRCLGPQLGDLKAEGKHRWQVHTLAWVWWLMLGRLE